MSESTAPDGSAPEGSAPEGSAPEGSAPEGSAPEGSAPDGSAPEGSAPEGSAPEGSAPEGSAPEGSAPDGSAPDGSAPDLEWVDPEELEPVDDPVGDALRAGNARYAAALAAADANALCDLFEAEGAIIDGVGPGAAGHEGLREMAHYARERFRDVTFEVDVNWTKTDPLDHAVAYAAGMWRMAFVPRDGRRAGDVVRSSGTFVETWHRGADGVWRLHRDLTLTREGG